MIELLLNFVVWLRFQDLKYSVKYSPCCMRPSLKVLQFVPRQPRLKWSSNRFMLSLNTVRTMDDSQVADASASSTRSSGSSQKNSNIYEKDGKLVFDYGTRKAHAISNFTTEVTAQFTTPCGKNGFIFNIEPHSSCNKSWQCALTLAQLCNSNKVLDVLQAHCDDSLYYRAPRDAPHIDLGEYMYRQTEDFILTSDDHQTRTVASLYPGWQKDGTFILNEKIQVCAASKKLLPEDRRYVLFRKSKNIAQDRVDREILSKYMGSFSHEMNVNGLTDLLKAMRNLLTSNFAAACLALGGTSVSLGYQRIIQKGGECPVTLLTGDTETSKTTVLKACLSLVGNSDVKDYSAPKALDRSKLCDIPWAWDDPTDAKDVKDVVQALFNQAGKETVRSRGEPRSPPVISANFACLNDKRSFSRMAIILFERPNPILPSVEMEEKKAQLQLASRKAKIAIVEVLHLTEKFLSNSSKEDRDLVSDQLENIFSKEFIRSIPSYKIVVWHTIELLKIAGMNNEIPKIWSYIESTLAPFIMAAYGASKKRCEDARFQATSAAAGPVPKKTEDVINSITRTIKSFDKRQISQHIKLLEIKSMKSVGFSYNTLAPLIGVHPRKLCDELLEIPGAKKGRHYYLHKDSPTNHFKTKKGIDQVGKSSFNKSISVPGSSLSTNFIELVERKYAGGQASENGCDGEQRKKERKSKNKGDQNKAECEEEESLDECKGDDEDESGGEEIRAESEGVERSRDGIKGEKNLDEKGEEESETDDSEGEESMDEKVGEETVDEGEGDDNQDGSDHEESQEESNGIDSEGECKGEDIHLHSKGIQSKDQRKDNNVNKEKIPVKRKYRVKTEAEKLKDGLSITASTLPLKRCRRI